MATFDQLSAEQRAIIELVLRQGRSYEEISDLLDLPQSRVRQLARQSLVRLSPVSAAEVDEDWRGEIADYLLLQQSGRDATATRSHLRRSEEARAWSRSILDSLDQFYDPANLPTIPTADGAGTLRPKPPKRAKPAQEQPADPASPPPARGRRAQALRGRELLAGIGLAILAALALFVWPVGLLTGDDSNDGKTASADRAQPRPRVIGQLLLRPVGRAEGTGVAVIAARGKQRQLIVQARLPATSNGEAYEVWLYDSNRRARSLGAQVTDRQGMFQGAGPLPEDFARFDYIDVSREKVDRNPAHSGNSVLRGRIADFTAPSAGAEGGQGTTPPSGRGR